MLRAVATGALVTFLTATGAARGGMMGAPAPLPKPRPPMQVAAGSHVLVWGGMRFQMHLGARHHYAARHDGGLDFHFLGSWNWCPDKRVLVISETLGRAADAPPLDGPPPSYTTYTIRLDENLRGHTQAPGPQIEVRVEPLPPAKKKEKPR
jgi:hypothetical protein